MLLNADAGDLLHRAGAKFVHIMWDSDARKVALRPLTRADKIAFKLTSKAGRRGMAITAGSFLRYIRWNSANSATVPVEWNEESKVLEASLPSKFIGR